MYANPTQQEDTSFVELRCPSCQHMLEPPEGIFDRQIVCPACHRALKWRGTKQMADGTTRLDPRFTFAEFVVAPCNRFAFEMASLVVRNSGGEYNPLIIHGGEGNGRTHLMHAIGHHLLAMPSGMVRYVTSEALTNAYIEALQSRGLVNFRNTYRRRTDVLLLDDLDFLYGKERMTEEVSYLVGSLVSDGRQVVVTCDRSSASMVAVNHRLASCLERGLAVGIGQPDAETCVRILEQKLKRMSVSLPSDIVQFIAEHAGANVRRLEGALARILAYASVESRAPDLPQVQYLLRDYVDLRAEEATHTEDRQRMATTAA